MPLNSVPVHRTTRGLNAVINRIGNADRDEDAVDRETIPLDPDRTRVTPESL